MTARPILFSAPMIRALLDGRKTQTRRVVKPQPADGATHVARLAEETVWRWMDDRERPVGDSFPRPYAIPGELCWVRENFYQFGGPIEYAAEGAPAFERKMTPSIHMPRAVSRLTLKITEVRVERLHGISEADAKAEGVERCEGESGWKLYAKEWGKVIKVKTARASYYSLWTSINGAESFEANPWVWALTFGVDKRNVDDVLRDAKVAA